MLKLQSKDGKFDIVLSDASLKDVGNVQKANVRSLSSAGRRKTREIKGHHVLPSHKDESPRQQLKHRESKSYSLKNSHEDQKAVEPNKDALKKSGKQVKVPEKASFKGAQKMQTVRNPKQKHIVKEVASHNFDALVKKTSNFSQKSRPAEVMGKKKPGVITQSEMMLLMESLKNGDDAVLQTIGQFNQNDANPAPAKNTGMPESVSDHQSIPGNEHVSYETKEPSSAPGRGKVYYKDSISTISMNEIKTEDKMPIRNKDASPEDPASQDRPERFAMRSSFAIGAPGQVAFDYGQTNRDRNRHWLNELEKQMEEKKNAQMSEKDRLALAMENPSSLPLTNRHPKEVSNPLDKDSSYTIVKDSAQITEKQRNEIADKEQGLFFDSSHKDRNYARGQHVTKSQFELDEIERQRQKILEHQKAVEQQVEEKRRLKMMERERKIREEREEEQRLAKERESLARQYEEEARKQMEKEEAERQRHMALQQSVLEAYDAALKEKQNAMIRKLKAGGHDISKLEHRDMGDGCRILQQLTDDDYEKDGSSNTMHHGSNVADDEGLKIEQELSRLTMPSHSMDVPYQLTSRSDKEFRPILNLTDDSYEEKREKEKRNPKDTGPQKEISKQKARKNDPSVKNGKEAKADEKDLKKMKTQTKKADARIISTDSTGKKGEKEEKPDASVNKGKRRNVKKSTKEQVINRGNISKDSSRKEKLQQTGNKPKSDRLVVNYEKIEDNLREFTPLGSGNDETVTPALGISFENDETDNYVEFSYNRSSTVTLEETIPSTNNSLQKSSGVSNQQTKDEGTSWDSWGLPTERQHQILQQLRELRKVRQNAFFVMSSFLLFLCLFS